MTKTSFLFAGLTFAAALSACAAAAQMPVKPIVEDARSRLKPGFAKPDVAAWNTALVSNTPSPPGFANPDYKEGAPAPALPPPPAGAAPSDPDQIRPNMGGGPAKGVTFANTDLGFSNGRIVMGNFHGFNLYDAADRDHPKLLASVACPGGQGDVSILGNLVFFSVEQTRARLDCGPGGVQGDVSKERFRGIRIFDVSNPAQIRQVAAIQTCRGSHTHTLMPVPGDPTSIYIYNQGTNAPRPAEEMAGCSGKQPSEDANTSLFSIDIIKVPLAAPEKAEIVASPRIFADADTGAVDGLAKKDAHGPGAQALMAATDQCHDITVYPEMSLAAGACAGNGLLLDIRDPAKPVRLAAVGDPNFAYWHAAIFSNDAKKVVFTDEWGGGVAARCRLNDPANWGGDIVYDIEDGRRLVARALYKLPAAQKANENCVAHNGGIVPVPGRDIVVQGWYSGGVSVFDITDSAHPVEIAYFDRGPLDPDQNYLTGHWAAYWYNGRIYAPEITRGLDVIRLTPSAHLTANEIAAAELIHPPEMNTQTQLKAVWPDRPVVAQAYLDQLAREKGLAPATIAAARKALEKPGAANAALADELAALAAKASGANGERLSGVARILRAVS